MKNVFLLLLVFLGGFLLPFTVQAQISYGGTPPSFDFQDYRFSPPLYEAVVDFDVKKLIEEDKEYENSGNPLRCAKNIPVHLDAINNGEWFTLPDGTWIWQLEIYAPDALAILLQYEKFIIPEGGKLFLYNPEKSKILGAYTEKTNTKGAEFATELVGGDRIILEYVAPPTDEMLIPQIEITGVGYGYNHIIVTHSRAGESESCMININCSEGYDWQTQKKGVARTLTPINTPEGTGWYLCSGTLINNTACNLDPLYLSAHHCFYDKEYEVYANFSLMIFYFNYEDPDCPRLTINPQNNTMTGSESLVLLNSKGYSDGALLRLNNNVPEKYGVYFNGWDKRNVAATSGVCIHHPAGDVKKISTFTSNANAVTWNGQYGPGATNAAWNVIFSATANGRSVTEGGSSGSPLFNQNKLVVGTLTGGNSSCALPNGSNVYGAFWYHWDQSSNPQQRMKQYLDPAGTGVETLRGISHPTSVDFYPDEEEFFVVRPVQFVNNSVNDISWEWSFPGGNPTSSTEKTPPSVIYNTSGTYTASLIINKGLGDESAKEFTFNVVVKENLCPEEKVIGSSSEQTQFPLGAENRQIFSSSIYKANELNLDSRGYINKISWNTANASSTQRKVYIYLKETDNNYFTEANSWADEITNAVLVYETPSDWISNSGWVTFDLIKPFKYSGSKNLKVIVRTLSAASQGYINSNCYYTMSANSHQQWIADTGTIPGTSGEINSRRSNIKFNIDIPCGFSNIVADFSMNNSIENTLEIYRDDIVSFKDLSIGPAVNWNWTFEGGTPNTSLVANPNILFHNKGTFNVKLSVNNTLGSDSKNKTIIVKTKNPEPNFISISETGLTTYPNYGQLFSKLGGEVTLIDVTKNYNDTRIWQLHGLNSVPYRDSIITAIYPNCDAVTNYSISLQATNEAGTVTKRKNDFIQLGGSSKVWNIPLGDNGDNYFISSEGNYLTGVNADFSGIAEKFTTNFGGQIHNVQLMIKAMEGDVANRSYYVTIYSNSNGKPGSAIVSPKTVKGSDINPNGYTRIDFDPPINVTGTFYVVLSGLSTNAAKIAIASSNENDKCTVFGYFRSGGWGLLSDFYKTMGNVSLNVIPHFTCEGDDFNENIDLKSISSYSIYPNPINDSFVIKGEDRIHAAYIKDIQGRMIYSLTDINKNEINISSNNWAKGIYLLTIKTDNGVYSYKLIKN